MASLAVKGLTYLHMFVHFCSFHDYKLNKTLAYLIIQYPISICAIVSI